MSAYTKQSRKPKPATAEELIKRFQRDMKEAGMHVTPIYNIGSPYMPSVTIEVWVPKKSDKEATN